jgi:parvulin-like peptidyl-prolyl isomerase
MQSNHGYLAIVLVPVAILAGCSKTGGGALQDGGLDPKASQVLVEVGGEAITLGEFSAALDHMNQFDRLRYQGPERRKELLEEMINIKLLAQEAKRRGYDKDPLVRQEVREILRDAVLERARVGIPEPRDLPVAEVRAYFEAHRDDFRDPERRRLSVIVLKDEATAKEVLAAAKKDASPEAWGQLVKARSIDAQAKGNGPVDLAGDFGFVSPPGDARGPNARVPEAVRQAAFARAGTGVVDRVIAGPSEGKGDAKWFVVNVTQKEEPRTRSYEEAERSIRIRLVQEKIEQSERALVDTLKKKYPVTVDEEMVKKVAKELEAAP